MATRKETAAEEVKTEVKPAEEPAVKDEWDEKVEIRVPRAKAGEANYYYVCVNDRRYQIPADGKKQSLPRPIAELLEQSIEAEYEADRYADRMSEE